MELHVGEHRQAQRHDLPDTGGALRGDELEAHLQAADMWPHRFGQVERMAEVRRVERHKNRIRESQRHHPARLIGAPACGSK